MNETILKHRPQSPLSGDLGANCKSAKLGGGKAEPGCVVEVNSYFIPDLFRGLKERTE
jgi:hypothetical protein